jgi:hypothetical protein
LKALRGKPSTGTRRSLDRLWACADGKSLVVVGEDVLKMTGSAYDEEVAAIYAKYETCAFWVGRPYLTKRLGFPFDELLSSVATTGRSAIMGLSRVGCRPKVLTDC